MSVGWFRVNRRMFDNCLWLSEPFTKAQAWIDLFGNANHKDGYFFVRGNEVKVKRGQLGWSEVTMAKRWSWSRNKVRRFLKWLETEQQIEQQKLSKITTIITILNYDKYQNDTPDDTTERQQKDNRRYTNKNDKNDKNDNNDKKRKYGSIKNLGEDEFGEVAEQYNVPLPFVRSVYDDMVNYCESKGKTYRNYLATLRNWVKKEALEVKKGQRGKQNITYVGDTT